MTEPTPSSRTTPDVTSTRLRERYRALGDPTRHGIFRAIADREDPVAVADLSAAFALNHNTVREHLRKLREAGLVEEITEPPRGPGRPRLLYRLTERAASGWNDEGPYERLSMLLLEVAGGKPARQVGRQAGRRMRLDRTDDDPVVMLTAAMTAQGFAPEVDLSDVDANVVLKHCPFASAAEADAHIVCDLHRGMLEGLADQLEGIDATELTADAPRSGRCAVRVALTSAD